MANTNIVIGANDSSLHLNAEFIICDSPPVVIISELVVSYIKIVDIAHLISIKTIFFIFKNSICSSLI